MTQVAHGEEVEAVSDRGVDEGVSVEEVPDHPVVERVTPRVEPGVDVLELGLGAAKRLLHVAEGDACRSPAPR
ncbi:MAG TPA: hypothetical protein VMS64_10915 [Candidatus Methylomirabilis sp.]|nr:hypothetical protein [Candidatus Methylomirabilis sp.]